MTPSTDRSDATQASVVDLLEDELYDINGGGDGTYSGDEEITDPVPPCRCMFCRIIGPIHLAE